MKKILEIVKRGVKFIQIICDVIKETIHSVQKLAEDYVQHKVKQTFNIINRHI